MIEASPRAAELARAIPPSTTAPWELFAQRASRYELHLTGAEVSLVRGPLSVEGFGVRLFRPHDKAMRVGFAASNIASPDSVHRTFERAEAAAPYSSFPCERVELPSSSSPLPQLSIVDERFVTDPEGVLEGFVAGILAACAPVHQAIPSFGSIRASVLESSVANSEGLSTAFASTEVDFEFAVKADGGPEGVPPGEFWVNRKSRRVTNAELGVDVAEWARLAEDMRRAKPPATGAVRMIVPPEALADIVPAVLGFRLSGPAELRRMGTPLGAEIGSPGVRVVDDGHVPWGTGSQPVDDEGRPTGSRPLVEDGKVANHLYDTLHAAALSGTPTGSASRMGGLGSPWYRFATSVGVTPGNLVIPTGSGGSLEELAETVGEGLWLLQLGGAFPDPLAGTYGGEIRAAYRIRGGKVAEAVRGGTVGGPVVGKADAGALLMNLLAFGSTSQRVGALTAPPVIADRVAVAGPD
jgi:predicted Zn-dependent protease